MQAFKIFFKVLLKSSLGSIIMYAGIFIGVAVLFTQVGGGDPTQDFMYMDEASVAVIDNDNSEMSLQITDFLASRTNLVAVENNENAINDALFFRAAQFILVIPKNYEHDFLSGRAPVMDTYKIPEATASIMVSMMLDKYLSMLEFQINTAGKPDYASLNENMALSVDMKMIAEKNENSASANYLINYLVYPLLGILIFSVSSVTQIFRKKEIRMRTNCSPMKNSSYAGALFCGNGVLTLILFIVLVIVVMIFEPGILCAQGIFWIANAFVFAIVALSISFFLSYIVKKEAVMPLANLISLGCCFLGGVFVPQSALSAGLLKFAVVIPSYWYVKANDFVAGVTNMTFENLAPAFKYMGIELIFAAAFFGMTMVAAKSKRTA